MKFAASLCLFGCASAARVNVHKRASPVQVKLESVGNSAVKASFTNTGSEPIKIFKTGSVLDSTAVEKAEIYSALSSEQVAFDGIRLQIDRTNVNEDALQTLEAGETVDVEWDPAEVHDLSAGGDFDFLVRGSFLTADPETNKINGVVPFDSNLLASHVDGVAAAKVRRAFHENLSAKMKRTNLQDDCTGSRGNAQRTALQNCASLATQAAQAASNASGSKLQEYFKSSSSSTRSTVAEVFNAIAEECGSTTSGISDQYCTDVLESCQSNVLAYTVPSQNVMVSCPTYFNALEALTTQCHEQDQASTTLHETTHLREIKGTQDYGYGYDAVQQLSSSQNLNNADTYTLFANAIDVGC